LGDYATKPIYFFGGIGFIFMLASFFVSAVVLYQRIFRNFYFTNTPLFLLAVFIFMLSIILIMMGVLAEVMTRTYYESQNKKTYRIRETVGF
jgi:dolichol-phosphate mannosyltransferase